MGEIKKLNEPPKSEPLKRVGGNSVSGQSEVKILTATEQPSLDTQPVVLDRNSPVEDTKAELHVHADRKSFKEATKKDQ
jgi:hypothetical protein